MRLNEINGIKFYLFEHLLEFPGIRHGIFARCGGNSKGPYQSLNVGRGLGDTCHNIKENRKHILTAMGGNDVVYVDQNHGTEILVFNGSDKSDAPIQNRDRLIGDAMITDIAGKFLAVQVADCQAVLMVDPLRKIVANIHSGWRGSIQNIIGRTLGVMNDRFGCNPTDVSAGIGPSLGPCCAEFRNYRNEIPERFWKYKDRQDHFDFWSISTDQLVSAGVQRDRIALSGLCTKCRTDLFYSYRGEGTTGRFAAVIGLSYA